ncbi:Thioredoxin, mitochondrial [Trichinella murrelli]|uniref:Thioredoxin, mitochondrial n=1 Tax=Trichinella murrelli TaxID=144512 RepID=A0A0V0TSL0_9BILA|nr:Thioredoxin, mitochondrial [Trichinella murrelli]
MFLSNCPLKFEIINYFNNNGLNFEKNFCTCTNSEVFVLFKMTRCYYHFEIKKKTLSVVVAERRKQISCKSRQYTVRVHCQSLFGVYLLCGVLAMRLSGRFASAARNLVQKRVYATWASSARMLTLNNNFAKASIVSKSQPPPMRLFCSENSGGSCSFKVQDYEDFKDRVIGAEKPVVVQFYADWCGPCQLLSPRLETAVSGQQGKLALAKVDVDDCADLALEYGVASIPTVMAFRRGSVVDQFSGVIEDELIVKFLNKLAAPRPRQT